MNLAKVRIPAQRFVRLYPRVGRRSWSGAGGRRVSTQEQELSHQLGPQPYAVLHLLRRSSPPPTPGPFVGEAEEAATVRDERLHPFMTSGARAGEPVAGLRRKPQPVLLAIPEDECAECRASTRVPANAVLQPAFIVESRLYKTCSDCPGFGTEPASSRPTGERLKHAPRRSPHCCTCLQDPR